MTVSNIIKNLSRRSWVRIISFFSVAIVVLAGTSIYGYSLARNYRTTLEYTYQRALEDLSDYLDNINIMLKKSIYVGTAGQFNSISDEIWRESTSAKNSLSQLPVNTDQLSNINLFLSQTGDYCIFLSKKALRGETFTKAEHDNLISLSTQAQGLSERVNNMTSELSGGQLWNGDVEQVIKDNSKNTQKATLIGSLNTIEQGITDYPTLIYDGPFSQHINNREPLMTKGKQMISRDKARSIAAEYLSADMNTVKDDSDEAGTMPSYGFKTDSSVISITKKGGLCVYMRNTRKIDNTTLSFEQAKAKAFEYLEKHDLRPFKESYYMTEEGVCVINFAYMDGKTICYPDLVKVGVALDNGEIVLFEARGYIMNHTKRTLPKPKYSESAAQKVLSKELTVKSSSLALIPTSGNYEIPCYGFACTGRNKEDVLVYVNTQTLAEEQILILLKTDGGMLTK